MTDNPQEPEWLVEGGEVLTRDRDRAQRGRIARLTKRDVVLEDGRRFNRARLNQQDRHGFSPTVYLCAPTDAGALELLHQERVRWVLIRLENALVEHRRSRRIDSAAVLSTLRSAIGALEKLEAGDDR